VEEEVRKTLGLAGKAGAGKDYVCELIQGIYAAHGLRAERVAFADGLKQDIEETLGLNRGTCQSIPVLRQKPYTPEVRALLQWWGTELRRSQDEDYWVKKGMEMIERSTADLVIVTDVRFANEAEIIRDHGGIVAEVFAESHVRQERLGGVLPPEHASEVIDFEVDAIILNQGVTHLAEVEAYLWELGS
jgi:phosphomevalonate kinase